jgi:hypothetical protein
MSPKNCARLAVLLVVASLGACDRPPPPPKTFPVRGTIAFTDGGAPSAGTIEFRSVADSLAALGQVQADGSFSLSTLAGAAKLDGAVEGQHRVTFVPAPAKGEMQSTALPVSLAEPIAVRSDAENNFKIKIDRPRSP